MTESLECYATRPFQERKSFPTAATYLCEVLLRDPPGPFNAQVQGAARVGHIGTLNHHALDQDLVLRKVLPNRVTFTVAALNLENIAR